MVRRRGIPARAGARLSKSVGSHDMQHKLFGQGVEAPLDAVEQQPVACQSAVVVAHEMLDFKQAEAGDRDG